MARLLATVAVAFLLGAPLAAADPPALQASVKGLRLEGPFSLEGRLGSLLSVLLPQEARSSLDPPPPDGRTAPTGLHLSARHLHVESDLQRQSGSPAVGKPQQGRAVADYDGVEAEAPPARPMFLFFLGPWPGHDPPTARLAGSGASVAATAEAGGEAEHRVSSDRPLLKGAPGPGTEVALSAGAGTLRVEGDLALMLWEWDLNVTSASGPGQVRSGYTYEPIAPSAAGVDTWGTSEERQAFVYAEGAVLDLTLPAGVDARLFLQPAAAALDGRLFLEGPAGSLATQQGARPLHDGDFVDGAMAASFAGLRADGFQVEVQGSGLWAQVQGQDVALGSGAALPRMLVAAVATLGLAMPGAWLLRRRAAPAPPPASPPAPRTDVDASEEDQLLVLRWLGQQASEDPGGIWWDSDLMRAFDWPAEKAQGVVRTLERRGILHCRDVELPEGRTSIGALALTRAGWDRVRAPPTANRRP
jgi:hypothetical protein